MATTKTYVNYSVIKETLIKSGWTLKDDVYSSDSDTHIKFMPKTIRIVRGDKIQTIKREKATNASLAACIQSLNKKNEILEHTDIDDLTEPVEVERKPAAQKTDANREQSQAVKDAAIKAKEEAAKKKEEEKEAAKKAKEEEKAKAIEEAKKKMDEERAKLKGKTPTFDALTKAFNETVKAEEKVVSVWQPIAEKYQYSVKGLIADLHLEGRWPDKTDKNGVPFAVDGITVPAGYKSVYDTEKEAGIEGAGHMVNRAARMLSKLNPNQQKREAKEGSGSTGGKQSEKTVEAILIEMSNLAKKLSKEDLQSWLETDASVVPIIDAMRENENVLDAL